MLKHSEPSKARSLYSYTVRTRTLIIFFTCILSIIFLSSCSLINFEELDISSNVSENQMYFNENNVRLYFSIEPDKTVLKSLLSLRKNDSVIGSEISWTGSICSIQPKEGFKKNTAYRVSINGRCRTHDDRYYNIKFERSFIYGTDNDLFLLISIKEPKTDSAAGNTASPSETSALELNFNRSVDIADFENNFSVTPFIQLKKEYEENDTKIIIKPQTDWSVNTYFTWSIKNLKSADGYELAEEASSTFCAKEDLIQCKLVSVNAAEISDIINLEYTLKNDLELSNQTPAENAIAMSDSIAFKFNKDIDFSSFKSQLSIIPAVRGSFAQDKNTILFIPESSWKINTEYTVFISGSIKDTNGIPMHDDEYFSFKTSSNFLSVKNIALKDKNTTVLTENPDSVTVSDFDTLFAEITFSDKINSKNLTKIEQAVSLEAVFPLFLKTPKLKEIKWSDSNRKVTLKYEGFSFSDTDDYIYRLKINSSPSLIVSESGEYMEDDTWTVFITR